MKLYLPRFLAQRFELLETLPGIQAQRPDRESLLFLEWRARKEHRHQRLYVAGQLSERSRCAISQRPDKLRL